MKRLLLTVCLLGFSTLVLAEDQVDINVSNDTGKVIYSMPHSLESFRQSQKSAGLFFNSDSDVLVEAGLHISGEVSANVPGLSAGLGVDAIAGSAKDATVFTLPLALEVMYRPDFLPRALIKGYLKFAPNILAYIDAERFRESGLRVGYELLPETVIYAGARRITFDLDKIGRKTVDNGLHLGVRFSF